jgi:YidC/Oxa1 family membrane protein insertase
MQQKRLLLALAISTAILLSWSFLFPPKTPEQPKPQPPSAPTIETGQAPSTGQASTDAPPSQPVSVAQIDDAPQRIITIKTPLYDARLDSHGAEIVSWIIKKNKYSEREIHSSAGSRANPVQLELVSPEGLKRTPRDVPLQVVTDDNQLDQILVSRNYRVEGVDGQGDVELNLAVGETKSLRFLLRDASTGLEIEKKILFDANGYTVDFNVLVKRGGQPIPQVKVKIGPSIGDQGVRHYTFYSVAPEAIASFGGKIQRHHAPSINENKSSPDRLVLGGNVEWAGIADTYFGMVGVPANPANLLELRTVQYDYKSNGNTEKRYLLSAFLPIAADGSRNIIYLGPKDHYLLTEVSQKINQTVGHNVDLEGLIDYGFLGWLSRPIAVPILWCITALYRLTGSYGFAIIIFTIVIYSLFFPLKWRSSKAMKKAQKLAPKMKELQDKIKGMKQNDPRLKELQVEQLRLMKEGNPLGGCLPLLIQMPFLFALYRAITISLDFRQATFMWLPDLSAGDPYHILEILMSGTMIVLQLITPAPSADPLQRKIMAIGMPVFMLYVLWGAPSGLLLYWLVGNIVGFSQQFLINNLTKSEDDAEPPAKNSKGAGSRKKLAAAGT